MDIFTFISKLEQLMLIPCLLNCTFLSTEKHEILDLILKLFQRLFDKVWNLGVTLLFFGESAFTEPFKTKNMPNRMRGGWFSPVFCYFKF